MRVFVKKLVADISHAFGQWVLMITAGLGVLLLGFIFVVGNTVYPYHPVTVYEYRAMPMEVCPGDDVAVKIDWEVRDDLRAIEIVYRWRERNDSALLFGGEARFEDVPVTARETRPGLVVPVAPTRPGIRQIELSYNIFGVRFGMPVRQDIDNISDEDFIRVLKADDKKCEGKP